MASRKFKIGDKVKCNDPLINGIHFGKVYEVKAVRQRTNEIVVWNNTFMATHNQDKFYKVGRSSESFIVAHIAKTKPPK